MSRTLMAVGAGLLILSVVLTADAKRIAPPPAIVQRVAQADAVLSGKVVEIEGKNVTALAPHPGSTEMVEYQVAVVKIDQAIHGVPNVTQVRVAFLPGGRSSLSKDQQVCLFLTRHPKETFYVLPGFYDVLDVSSPEGEKELELVKRCGKLLADPIAGMKSKDADDRLLTVAGLIVRYRQPTAERMKTEEVPAEESKLILQTLAEADWLKPNTQLLGYASTPQALFQRLGLQPADGWKPTANLAPQNFSEAAKTWLREHAATYRVKRFVAENKD